jgi:hypothetical protein
VNEHGELAGVVVLDSRAAPTASALRPPNVFGGGGLPATAPIPSLVHRAVYALSHEALAPLVEKASAPNKELLFTLSASPVQNTKPATATNWSVQLGSEETLDAKTFAVPAARSGVRTLSYPGAGRCASLALSERKTLDGPLAVYYPNGKELLHADFFQGRRQGSLTVNDAEGRPILAVQFDRDLRNGSAAYFKNGAPWLIEEYADDQLVAQHLVKEGTGYRTLLPDQPHPARETVDSLLARCGAWPQWDSSLKKVEAAVERWAEEVDRNLRATRSGRSNADQVNAAQRYAVKAIEELIKLAE